jgi:transcriptional regulator with XRE-family HTH domain
MNLGKVIRQLREARGWNQDELAYRIGTTAASLSRIEHDHHFPRPDLLNSIAFTFEMKVYELIALTEGVQVLQIAGKYSTEEEALLRSYRKMPREEKALFQAIGESFSRVRRTRSETPKDSE